MSGKHALPGHIIESPEEVLSTMHKDGKRRWLYPTLSKGNLYLRRKILGWLLIVLFFGLPVAKIGGQPAMFLDIIHRRFVLFGKTFYATDTIILWLFGLTILLIIAAVTAVFGRVWCGWACPQTVYMEFIFRPIDRLIEGKESARRKLDEGPWTGEKIAKKGAKLVVYTLIAAAMAHSFVAYFVSWDQLLVWMQSSPATHWGFFLMMAITTALVVFDFYYFREQMCTIACPYARIQSVLQDRDSMIVSYDSKRGEPRGRRKRGKADEGEVKLVVPAAQGDCIDCGACVRTCPTGIDIRNGLQMECIGCTQCIDACDAIMISVKQPVGLIRYTSENALEGKPTRILRPRVGLYMGLMALVGTLFTLALTSAGGLEVEIFRAPGAPFAALPTGEVSNRVKIRVHNRTDLAQDVRVELVEPEGARVQIVGPPTLTLTPGQMKREEAWVVIPKAAFKDGQVRGRFRVGSGPQLVEEIPFTLLGPK
jgi:cytochrome c oxidase accessory protein FixG